MHVLLRHRRDVQRRRERFGRRAVAARSRRRSPARGRARGEQRVRLGLADRHQPHRRRHRRRQPRVARTPRRAAPPVDSDARAGDAERDRQRGAERAASRERQRVRQRRSGCSACHVFSSRSPSLGSPRGVDDGRSAMHLFVEPRPARPSRRRGTPPTRATPPGLRSAPSVSSRATSIHARRSSPSQIDARRGRRLEAVGVARTSRSETGCRRGAAATRAWSSRLSADVRRLPRPA